MATRSRRSSQRTHRSGNGSNGGRNRARSSGNGGNRRNRAASSGNGSNRRNRAASSASGRNGRNGGKSSRNGKPIRYAVLGLGYISQIAMLPAFAHAKRNSVLAALVSDDPKKLKTLGRRYGVDHLCSYDEVDELYASGDVDAVYIATPNSRHRDDTVRAANAGMHVLVEKPMAISREDCEEMIHAAKQNRVKLMVAYRLHFERANLEAAELVRSGKLGEARYFSSAFSQQVGADNVRLKAGLGGGPVWDMGIYCINAARAAFAAEPLEVIAATVTRRGDTRFREVPETVTAVMRFPKNRIAAFTTSFGAADRSVYEVVGTEGSISLEAAYEFSQPPAYKLRTKRGERERRFDKSDEFAPELLYFSDCILRNREPEPSGQEGLADVRVILAIHESIETGRWVRLELPQRSQRPNLAQELRRPGIEPPPLVHASTPSA